MFDCDYTTVLSLSKSILKMHENENGGSLHLRANQNIIRYPSNQSATVYVGVRSAKACMTANGFSRVPKQHSHPLLFPFFSHAAYDWLFQRGQAFHFESIILKQFYNSYCNSTGFDWKTPSKGETATVHFRHQGGTIVTLQPEPRLNIFQDNGHYCTPHIADWICNTLQILGHWFVSNWRITWKIKSKTKNGNKISCLFCFLICICLCIPYKQF